MHEPKPFFFFFFNEEYKIFVTHTERGKKVLKKFTVVHEPKHESPKETSLKICSNKFT